MADQAHIVATQQQGQGQQQQDQSQQGQGTDGQGQQAGQQQQQAVQQQQPAGVTLSKEELTEAMTAAAKAAQPGPQETPEQMLLKFNQAFNVYQFQADKLSKLGYSPEQIAEIVPIYEDIRDGLVKQAVTMSNYQMALLRQELEAKFAPALAVAQRAEEERLKNEFMEQNADLKGFEPLLEQIKARYVASGFNFKSKDPAERKKEIFTAIANEAKGIIKSIRENGQAAGAAGQGQQQSQRMSTVTSGGQGGAGGGAQGGGGTENKINATAKAIFG